MQIGDFSGYTDIARMLASSASNCCSISDGPTGHEIREFWNRRHITLSNWFRDYVYIPLGGNRVGRAGRLSTDDDDDPLGPMARVPLNFVLWGYGAESSRSSAVVGPPPKPGTCRSRLERWRRARRLADVSRIDGDERLHDLSALFTDFSFGGSQYFGTMLLTLR